MDRTKEKTNGREHEDDYVHKILFAAVATLAMACLKSIFVVFFVEQWRSRVFLILNLVLLAIFFTSSHSSSTENQESSDNAEMKIQEKKRRKQCDWSAEADGRKESQEIGKCRAGDKDEVECVKVDSESQKLTKEELNERAEAFIARFRQHLVSDARKCRKKPVPLNA